MLSSFTLILLPLIVLDRFARCCIEQIEVSLHTQDLVVLNTEDIREAESKQQQQYGIEKLLSVIQANRHLSAKQIRHAAIADLKNYIANHRIYDDITLVVIKQI